MSLLDRYVVVSFLKNYAIALVVLIGLYVVLDMVFNLDVLTQVKASDVDAGAIASLLSVFAEIASFYFYKAFVFFVQLSGIVPVVAAAFTLMRLARFNELTAFMAAGIPLQRVAMPVVLLGAIVNLVLLPINQELLIPRMIPQLTRDVDDLAKKGANAFTVTGIQDEQHRELFAGRYTPPGSQGGPAKMEYVDVFERNDAGQVVAHITADGATWDDKANLWHLTNGRRLTGFRPDDPTGLTEAAVDEYAGNITPQELAMYRRGRYIDLLSTSQLNEMLGRQQLFGAANILRVRHMRFTQPLTNVIVLLLAIPCILTREPNRLKHAAGLTLAMTGLSMGSVFLFQQMAGVNLLGESWADKWPALMAWMPILIWGPIGVWMMDRVKT